MSSFFSHDIVVRLDSHVLAGSDTIVTDIVNFAGQYLPTWGHYATMINDVLTAIGGYSPPVAPTFVSGTIWVYSDPATGVPGNYRTLYTTPVLSEGDTGTLAGKLLNAAGLWIVENIVIPAATAAP